MTTEKPKFPTKDLLKAGADAPGLLVKHIVETEARNLNAKVSAELGDGDVEEYVRRLIRSQVRLARGQGAGAGAVTTATEMSSAVTGPVAVGAAVLTILGDLTALAWIQIRLSLMIAAAYGHDISDTETRVKEILMLHGLEIAVGRGGGRAVGRGAERVSQRLILRHLRGDALRSVTAMFRLVGIRFSRAGLLRGLPVINIPANAAVSDVTTRRSAAKARQYYRELPARPRTQEH